jgi:hypothetical protein
MIDQTIRRILGDPRNGCNSDPQGSVVVEAGDDDGFHALLSASYGCRTISFKPQPLCRAMLAFSASMNNVKHPIKIIPKVAGKDSSKEFTVNALTCGTPFPSSEMETIPERVIVGSIAIDDIVREANSKISLMIMKISDPEEIVIVQSVINSIIARLVQNFILIINRPTWVDDKLLEWLDGIRSLGYACRDLSMEGSAVHPNPDSVPIVKSFKWLAVDQFGEERVRIWCSLK